MKKEYVEYLVPVLIGFLIGFSSNNRLLWIPVDIILCLVVWIGINKSKKK